MKDDIKIYIIEYQACNSVFVEYKREKPTKEDIINGLIELFNKIGLLCTDIKVAVRTQSVEIDWGDREG